MASDEPYEDWSGGEAYEAYVGRWSRRVARRFIDWLEPAGGLRWLDVGCGTGALTATIVEEAEPAEVLGVDSSLAYLEVARRRLEEAPVRFEAGDAAALALPAAFDVAVSGLVLNFLPDPGATVSAMGRAVVDGGVVAAYVWDYAEGMELMRHLWDAAARLDESARSLDEGLRFPVCHPARLAEVGERAGLLDVETTGIVVPTVFADFDDYWSPFLGGQGPAPGYVRSLGPADQDALREVVRASLPVAADGSISLTARAWAVRGRVGLAPDPPPARQVAMAKRWAEPSAPRRTSKKPWEPTSDARPSRTS